MLPAMHTGKITRGLKPTWEPLIRLVGQDVVPGFMWMFALQLDDGAEVHAYKTVSTRKYVYLAFDGRAFALDEKKQRYLQVTPLEAVEEAFGGWEDAVPQPKHPEAVRAMLERHREAISQEMH
jgi:hypothetical protein